MNDIESRARARSIDQAVSYTASRALTLYSDANVGDECCVRNDESHKSGGGDVYGITHKGSKEAPDKSYVDIKAHGSAGDDSDDDASPEYEDETCAGGTGRSVAVLADAKPDRLACCGAHFRNSGDAVMDVEECSDPTTGARTGDWSGACSCACSDASGAITHTTECDAIATLIPTPVLCGPSEAHAPTFTALNAQNPFDAPQNNFCTINGAIERASTLFDNLLRAREEFKKTIPELWERILTDDARRGKRSATYTEDELIKTFKSRDGLSEAVRWLRRSAQGGRSIRCDRFTVQRTGERMYALSWDSKHAPVCTACGTTNSICYLRGDEVGTPTPTHRFPSLTPHVKREAPLRVRTDAANVRVMRVALSRE